MTSDLVLPASVTMVSGSRWGCIASSSGSVCATGAHSTTMSAPRTASSIGNASSITPRRTAVSSDAADRPTPMTRPTTPARRNASASEPPIKPTPTITNRELEKEEATTPPCQKKTKRHCSPMCVAADASAATAAKHVAGGQATAFACANADSSAPMQVAFSSGSPMLIRSHCGKP